MFGEHSILDVEAIASKVKTVLEEENRSCHQQIDNNLEQQNSNNWDIAKKLFPVTSFPWNCLPREIVLSLKQLARSCATNPDVLPGVAIAILSSVIGGTLKVSPKHGWIEPLIFWIAWIAASGTGKTPALNHLCEKIYDFQRKEDVRYENEISEYKIALRQYDQIKNSKARHAICEEPSPPEKAKSYFITNLTLEGLHHDTSGHGGVLHIREEISGFLSSQNQYKHGKGDDREGWLKLYDGKPARFVRASGSRTIYDLILNLIGGIQPETWWTEFWGKRGIFRKDGTIFRFMYYYEIDSFVESTEEIWGYDNSSIWDNTLVNALSWANTRLEASLTEDKALHQLLIFSDEARSKFIEWQNVMKGYRSSLPDGLKNYIPKVITQAARASGAIHCLDRFSRGLNPGYTLEWADIQKGIALVLYYFSHAIIAIESLENKRIVETQTYDEQAMHLAFALKSIRSDIDSGRLAIGYIWKIYNSLVEPEYHIKSQRSMGSLLRHYHLTITNTRHRANGKVGAYCLLWDARTEDFLKVHHVHTRQKSSDGEAAEGMNMQDETSLCPTETLPSVNNVNFDNSIACTVRKPEDNTCEQSEHHELSYEMKGAEK